MIPKPNLILITTAIVLAVGLLGWTTIDGLFNAALAKKGRPTFYCYNYAENTDSKCFDSKQECKGAQSSDSDATSKCGKTRINT